MSHMKFDFKKPTDVWLFILFCYKLQFMCTNFHFCYSLIFYVNHHKWRSGGVTWVLQCRLKFNSH
ncbi:hypothetical protein Hdeb2414_s0001g00032921 [Helianthus debilis subsp. tardiflorus]